MAYSLGNIAVIRHTCRNCAIKDEALCRVLPEAAMSQLNLIARRRKVRAGARIFSEGLEPPHVANIISGVIRLSKSLADGRTQIVALQFPAEFVGRPFMPDGGVLAEAATDVELCTYTAQQFETLLLAHEGMQKLLLQRMTEQMDAARDWMLLLGRKTAEERVASLILMCAEKSLGRGCGAGAELDRLRIELPLSRTEIADFLGLTLETVGRMIKRLEQAGAIDIQSGRGISIRNAALLRARSQTDQG